MFSVEDLITKESIEMHFQPILSPEKNCIIGFESLCRGIDDFRGIPPEYIFTEAKKQNHLLELDRLCRRKSFSSFGNSNYKDFFLFINFNASIIDMGVLGSMVLYENVIKNHLSPENIVIEIVESKVRDIESLKKFISYYRNLGFTIALDDVGSAYSNLERISILKPDILKIDRSLISNIHNEYYKQEILKSLVSLGKGIGALIIGEGVEKEEEALKSLEIGVNMLQGYYFEKPKLLADIDDHCLHTKINDIASKHKHNILAKNKAEKEQKEIFEKSLKNLIFFLQEKPHVSLDHSKKEMLDFFSDIECTYLLDGDGIQISETVFFSDRKRTGKNPFFRPGVVGSDHSVKDYYYQLKDSKKNYHQTCPYLSKATGNLCITLSSFFQDIKGSVFVLCVDLPLHVSSKIV